MKMEETHDKFMDEALALAELGRGWTSPNPVVGALVVKNGAVIGKGYHEKFGGPHAEIFALREAGTNAREATLYCTLEPCNHFGKTPPCVNAILEAGIRRVVLGARDPHTKAAGGIEALRAAGVEVIEGVREAECRRVNAPFFKFVQTGLPYVALKWAMSLDGKIATASGDSKWISNKKSRAFVHVLRARHDAVAVGMGTLKTDDPALNVRLDEFSGSLPSGLPPLNVKQPKRVVFDSCALTPHTSRLWNASPAGQPIFVTRKFTDWLNAATDACRKKDLRDKGAEVIEVSNSEHGAFKEKPNVTEALRKLGELGIMSVFVEGGASLLASFLEADCVNHMYVFIAPIIVGGTNSRGPIAGAGALEIAAAKKLGKHPPIVKRFDADVMLEYAL